MRQDLGIMPTDVHVVRDFYAQTLIIHPPIWILPLRIVASYIPPIDPSTEESIFLSILAFILSISQIAAVMMIWAGDLQLRIGTTHDASCNHKTRRLDPTADHLADDRSHTIHNACKDGAHIYIENGYSSGNNSTLKYPKIGMRDFTITNSTMHQYYIRTKLIFRALSEFGCSRF